MLKKISGWFWLTLLITGGSYLFVFRSLLTNITTHLPDWNDYPFYVWTLYQHVHHIKSLQWNGFFTGNIFYPYQGNLLFSDLLLPTSLFTFIGSFFSSNPITVFNVVLFFTLFLNIIAVWFFWSSVFKEKHFVFLSTFLLCISSVVFENSVHFQILGMWPFFFALGMLLRNQFTTKNATITGILLAVQFTNGAYLAIFFVFASAFWYFSQLTAHWNEKQYRQQLLRHGITVYGAFLLAGGFFLSKYIQVKHAYGVTRLYWEYIYYSLNITDYLFSTNFRSFASQLWPISKWNSLNRAGSIYPGAVLILGTAFGLGLVKKIKDHTFIGLRVRQQDVFFFLLLVWGFMASLGPRLRVNDVYSAIPLPYDIVVRTLPLVEPVRVNARWAFFVFIAMTYFTIEALKRFRLDKSKLVMTLCILIPLLEIVPLQRKTESQKYYDISYDSVATICQKEPKVMLEYPITQDRKDVNIVTNLTYRTQQMLASLKHKCILVNGYMGYEPPDYARYEQEITNTVNLGISPRFWELLKEKNVSFVKINKDDLYEEKVKTVQAMLLEQPDVKIIHENEQVVIVTTGL